MRMLSECGASIVGVGVLDDPRAIRESPLQKRGEIPVVHLPLVLPMGELSAKQTEREDKVICNSEKVISEVSLCDN